MMPSANFPSRAACDRSAPRACWTSDRYGLQYPRHHSGSAGKATSGLKECQQVGVELVFVSIGEAVGRACVDLQGRILNQLR